MYLIEAACEGENSAGKNGLVALPIADAINAINVLFARLWRLPRTTMPCDVDRRHPGLGVLHVDTPARDSLACDLMEPFVRRLML